MIKKTLYFGNAAYLSLSNEQLVIRLPEVEKNETLPESFKQTSVTTIPMEDIGLVLLDNARITITHGALEALMFNGSVVVNCDKQHMPSGLMLPLVGHSQQRQRLQQQLECTQPLRKYLWQQTVQAKITNQAVLLENLKGEEMKNMHIWSKNVKSDDSSNLEARAAVYYWANIFSPELSFSRNREGAPPNNLLNYGYAILRAVVARSLVASGLHPSYGIFHKNKYNPYCLADDIMEPYRPYVDKMVVDILKESITYKEIDDKIKRKLLMIPVVDVVIEGKRSPLMVAAQQTTASLSQCFSGESRKIKYPTMTFT